MPKIYGGETDFGKGGDQTMNRIGKAGHQLKDVSNDVCIEALCKPGTQEMIRESLEQTGRGSLRNRRLGAVLTVWLTLAMVLRRSDSIPGALAWLMSCLRGRFPGLSLQPVTDGAPSKARKRVGVAPLVALFRRLVGSFRPRPIFHGLRVSALDGTTLDMPDAPANLFVFGKAEEAAFPRLRLVALLDVCSRRIARFRLLHWRRSEHKATSSLVAGLGSQDLLLADRGLYAFSVMTQLLGQKASFLFRLPKNRVVKKKKQIGPGDWIGWICCRVPKDEIPSLPSLKVESIGRKYAQVRLRVRIIQYRIADGSSNLLVTNLLETEAIPAVELVHLYHRRWDIELAYDEVKIHLSHPPSGAVKTILRSKSPRLVIQEVYALLIAYNLVRTTILESAELHNLPPEDLSFVGALRAIELAAPHLASAQNAHELQRNYQRLLDDIAQCHNRRPRRKRRYARVVRRNQGRFSVKRSHHREQRIDFENSIFFAEAA